MPELPHGWRMRNSSVEVSGPPLEDDLSGDDDASDQILDIQPDSDGWEDAEDDAELVAVKCLACEETFPTVNAMISHCQKNHKFDLSQVVKQHGLDFYSTIKLVNYIRSAVAAGKGLPETEDAAQWADDKFLQPAMKDDALLFGIDDLGDLPVSGENNEQAVDASK